MTSPALLYCITLTGLLALLCNCQRLDQSVKLTLCISVCTECQPFGVMNCYGADMERIPLYVFNSTTVLPFVLVDLSHAKHLPVDHINCGRFAFAALVDLRGVDGCSSYKRRCSRRLVSGKYGFLFPYSITTLKLLQNYSNLPKNTTQIRAQIRAQTLPYFQNQNELLIPTCFFGRLV